MRTVRLDRAAPWSGGAFAPWRQVIETQLPAALASQQGERPRPPRDLPCWWLRGAWSPRGVAAHCEVVSATGQVHSSRRRPLPKRGRLATPSAPAATTPFQLLNTGPLLSTKHTLCVPMSPVSKQACRGGGRGPCPRPSCHPSPLACLPEPPSGPPPFDPCPLPSSFNRQLRATL